MSSILSLVRSSQAAAPAAAPVGADESRRHMLPAGAVLAACARGRDLSLYRMPGDSPRWFVRCGGIVAPIPADQHDAWHSLVCEVSCGHMRIASLARSVALLPGALIAGDA